MGKKKPQQQQQLLQRIRCQSPVEACSKISCFTGREALECSKLDSQFSTGHMQHRSWELCFRFQQKWPFGAELPHPNHRHMRARAMPVDRWTTYAATCCGISKPYCRAVFLELGSNCSSSMQDRSCWLSASREAYVAYRFLHWRIEYTA